MLNELHPLLGLVPKSGQMAWDHLEGDGEGYWTSNGVRRARLPMESEGAPILLIGNSYTEGLSVSDAEHYGHLLEKALRLRGKNIPVLSYGKSGLSVADYEAQGRHLLALFKPRWTIIQVCEQDFEERAWSKQSPGSARFVFVGANGSLDLRSTPLPKRTRKSLPRALEDKFPDLVPYSFAYRRFNEFEFWVANQPPWFRAGSKEGSTTRRLGILPPRYPLQQEMQMLARVYHHRMTILYLPRFNPQSPFAATQDELLFRKLAAQEGIRFVSLGDRFSELAVRGRSPYGFENTLFNFGHWNRYGHEAAAQLLLDDLIDLGV